jgi:multiple sugar transport system permease protein
MSGLMSVETGTKHPPESLLRRWEPALYIAPAFIVLGLVLVYPLGYSVWLSLHKWNLRTFKEGAPWVGLQNYVELAANADFRNALVVTFTFIVLAISAELIAGMGLALLLNRELKGKGIMRSLILIPMMCTNVVIGLTWRLLLNYQFGVVNYYLQRVGLPAVEWLSDPGWAMVSVVMVDFWNTTSFVCLMLLAGLQSLPEEPFEAARIDGASSLQQFRFLTLPLLKPIILVVLLWRFIDTFRIFDVIYLLTSGGPAKATETVSIFVHRYGFQSFNLSFSAAASFVMILIMLAVAGALAGAIGKAD